MPSPGEGDKLSFERDIKHAAGERIAGEGRAAGDHLRLVAVHVGPVLFQQFLAQRHRAEPVAVIAEELHADSLNHHAGPSAKTRERRRVRGVPEISTKHD